MMDDVTVIMHMLTEDDATVIMLTLVLEGGRVREGGRVMEDDVTVLLRSRRSWVRLSGHPRRPCPPLPPLDAATPRRPRHQLLFRPGAPGARMTQTMSMAMDGIETREGVTMEDGRVGEVGVALEDDMKEADTTAPMHRMRRDCMPVPRLAEPA